MITAMQKAKLGTANHLAQAREILLETRSSIAWEDGEHGRIDELITDIDALFRRLIP